MSVFLLILKILGFILLGILGIIMLLIAVVLFVPIRYEAKVEAYENPNITAKVHWLLHLLRVNASYEKNFDYNVKLMWIQLIPKNNRAKKHQEHNYEARSDDKDGIDIEFSDDVFTSIPDTSVDMESLNSQVPQNSNKNNLDEQAESMQDNDRLDEKGKPQKESRSNRRKSTRKPKKKRTKEKLSDKIKNIKSKFVEIKKKVDDPRNRKAVRHLKDELVRLLKAIWPKRCSGYLQYGFSDPSITGEITGVISLLPLAYQKRLHIIPDFAADENYFEGEITIKGRLMIVTLVAIALRLLLDKNVRYLYKQLG